MLGYREWAPVLGAACMLVSVSVQARPADRPTPVVVSRTVRRIVREPVWLVGTSEAPLRSTVASEVEGLVETFPVHEGLMVRRGDRLAVLNTTTLKNLLSAARARLTLCESECQELRRGLRPEEIARAKARLLEAEAELALTLKNVSRAKELLARNAASKQALDDAEARYKVAQQRVHAERAAHELARQGERQEKRDQAEARRADAAAEAKRLEDQVRMATITAPFAGQIVKENTQIGQWVSKGGAVVEMIQLNPVLVMVPVPERYISSVRLHDGVQVRFSALGSRIRLGKVVRILSQGDFDAHTFPVKVELDNPHWHIKSGMFARVRFGVGQARPALLAPKDAVVRARGMTLLVTVGPDGQVEHVPVQLGERFASMVEVSAPAVPGMKVIVRGNERVRPQQKVLATDEIPPDRYLAGTETQPTTTTQPQAPTP